MLKFFKSKLVLNYTNVLVILLISLCVIFFFAAVPPFNHWTWNTKNLDSSLFADYGQFISGFLGSFISLLSFILLYKTLTEQRQQFTEASFQNNFYSLLENHRNVLNSIKGRVEGISTEDEIGADFFADLALRIYIDFQGNAECLEEGSIQPLCQVHTSGSQRLVDIYDHHFLIYQSDLGHYFRNLYHFVRFIIESDVDESNKKRHMKILRAQLSNYEMVILSYNCMHKYGAKFKPQVERYELLQNLNFELNLNSNYLRRVIDPIILIAEYPHLQKAYLEQSIHSDQSKKKDEKLGDSHP